RSEVSGVRGERRLCGREIHGAFVVDDMHEFDDGVVENRQRRGPGECVLRVLGTIEWDDDDCPGHSGSPFSAPVWRTPTNIYTLTGDARPSLVPPLWGMAAAATRRDGHRGSGSLTDLRRWDTDEASCVGI